MNEWTYFRQPVIDEENIKDAQLLMRAGFTKVFFNDQAELVGAGLFEIADNWEVYVSLYFRERHMAVYNTKEQPKYGDKALWSGHVYSLVEHPYDCDGEPNEDYRPVTKRIVADFVEGKMLAKLTGAEDEDSKDR